MTTTTPTAPATTISILGIIEDAAVDASYIKTAISGTEAAVASFGTVATGTHKISDVITLASGILAAIGPLADQVQSQANLKF